MNIERKLSVWRPLKVGQRVVSKTWNKGASGTVVEALAGHQMNGLDKYGVKMDFNDNVADFCRYELKAA